MDYRNQHDHAQPWVGITDLDGTIYAYNSGRKGQAIGVDLQREKELLSQIGDMQDVIENYYSKLVELGAIVPEKSPEQVAKEAAEEQLRIAREQSEQQAIVNQALLDAVSSLKAEIAEIKKPSSVAKSETVEEKKLAKPKNEQGVK